jgi:hypothetical protein
MNMILHDFPTANILSGNLLASPKFKDGEQLRTYDYVVANPPFSDKTWTSGLTPSKDRFQRFAWGEPPAKQGDYAYLLHIIRSMKGSGKAACILPHGVLFRGNAEATIRQQLVRSGYLKGIIGLPANLFYGTGIPACIVVLDKENAAARKGVFMIDASKGFIKAGPKNRLREQDIHRIVDTFTRQADVPRYARMVPLAEIANPKNDFNLNLPRYIDSTEPEDIQDIDGHLRGGIPERDLDALGAYWKVLPSLRVILFDPAGRPGYARLKLPLAEVKPAILGHTEFAAFQQQAAKLFADWRKETTPRLTDFGKEGHPKELIETVAEELLATFRKAPLLDAYDVYQHLMDYWAEAMQDDAYLIAADGWVKGAQPREILQVRDKNNKLTWPEPHDYLKGRRRFKSDLVPAPILVARYYAAERDSIEALDNHLASLEQQLDEMREENSGEDGLLAEVIEGEGDKQKIVAKAVKARLKEIGKDPVYDDERVALAAYADLLEQQTKAKAKQGRAGGLGQEDRRQVSQAHRGGSQNAGGGRQVDGAAVGHRAGRDRPRLTDPHRPSLAAGRPLCRATAQARGRRRCALRPGRDPSEGDGCRMDVRPGYKQTEIGIPEDWDAVPLGSLFTFKNGLNKAKKYFGYGTPIVNYMDVFGQPALRLSRIDGRVDVSNSELDAFEVLKGDVFFTALPRRSRRLELPPRCSIRRRTQSSAASCCAPARPMTASTTCSKPTAFRRDTFGSRSLRGRRTRRGH